MSSLMFFGLALISSACTALVIRAEDKSKGNRVPPQTPVINWLQQNRHWHSFGHYIFEMALTFFVGCVSSVLMLMLGGHWGISPALIIVLFSLPSVTLTLLVEIVADGHWKAFIGQDPEWKDFLFDLFTHLMGSLFAVLSMLAVYKAIF